MPKTANRQYYLVRWGPKRRDNSNVRVTGSSVETGISACLQTFGLVAPDMWVKGVGPNKRAFRWNNTNKQRLIDEDEGWESMQGIPIPELDLEKKTEAA